MEVTVSSDGDAPASSATPADSSTDRPPAFGRFTRVRELGRGGMGVVYAAHDELLGRDVAIKTIRADRAGPVATARILREAKALARLSHPNVVQLHDASITDGRIFLTMEFVAGQTLRAWLSQRPDRAAILDAFVQAGRGLAAAHAAGLVHRDVKPDNILVGADGRVRVVDFGLVAPRGADEQLSQTQPDAPVDDTLTRAGAVLGTPGYMAPEQLRGLPADARSDQFGFCVALFEALHHRRPFASDDGQVTRSAVHRGRLDPDPGEVPAWLHRVLLRGLEGDPAARWPDMDALLAALLRDPQAARRRALRLAALLLLVAALAALLSLAGVQVARDLARARAEAHAEARLAALDAAVRRAEADDDAAAAEAAFRAFVVDPQHHGTRALTSAWLRRGDQRRDAGDRDAALAAYADAYVGARDPDDAAIAMRSLARMFHAAGDGPALERAAAAMRPQDDPERAHLLFTAALLQRDLPAAAAVVRELPPSHPDAAATPLFTALAKARPTGVRAWTLTRVPPGQPATFVAYHPGQRDPIVLDDQLREIARVRLDSPAFPIRDTPWLLTRRADGLDLLDLTTGATLWRTRSPVDPTRLLAVDLGGPQPDVLIGWQAPVRGFRRLTGLASDPAELVADPATEHSRSDLEAAIAGDFDGDGARELVVAIGGWQAYDLRVFTIADDGALVPRARRRMGRVVALAALPHGDGPVIAALKDDQRPNPDLFPDPPHTGEPAGVHLLRWTGSELAPVDVVPLRRRDGETAQSQVIAADLDGDGADELVFSMIDDGDNAALVLHAGASGWTTWTIDGVDPLADAELDGDPARELLVHLGPGDVWALGAGDQALPTLRPPPSIPRPPPAFTDPLLADRWARADELAAVGLPASAAASLQEVAHFTADRLDQAHLRDRAADLLVAADDDPGALALDVVATTEPTPLAAAALARSAETLTRLGRYDEAAAAASALATHPARTPIHAAAAEALQARLAPLLGDDARIDLDLAAPLADAWQVTTPAALRREADGLAFTLVADAAPAATLPLAWEGGPLTLELSAELTTLEHGACLRVAVEDADQHPWLGLAVCGGGGGGGLEHVVRYPVDRGAPSTHALGPVASATTPHRLHARIVRFPGRATAECTLEIDGRTLRTLVQTPTPPAPGRHTLVLAALPSGQAPTLAAGVLHRLTLRGARLAPTTTDDPAATAARLLVDGEPATARALADALPADHPRRDLLRALAGDDLHDPTAAAAALAPVLGDLSSETPTPDPSHLSPGPSTASHDLSPGPSTASHDLSPGPSTASPDLSPGPSTNSPLDLSPGPSVTALVLALRARPGLAAAIHAHAGPALLPLLAHTWSSLGHHHRRDPATRRLVLAALAGLEALRPADDRGRFALRDLLALRGRLWEFAGEPARARRDLLAALAVPAVADPDDARVRADLHAELARLLVDADPPRAREHATHAIAASPAPDATRLRLADMPAIAARLADDPAWRALLRTAFTARP